MIMLRFTRTHWMASIIGAALLGSSWQLMQLSYTIMSEPLFIALFLLGLLALLRYLEKPTLGWLLISALIFGLALFTRLMGVPLVGAACLVLLLYDERPWRDRLFRTVLFGAVAGLLLAGFMLRNIMVTGHATNRAFLNAAGLPPHFWRNLAGGLPFWAVPPWLDFKGIFKSVMRLSGAGIVASILIAIAMAWQILVRREKLFKMFFIFFGCYFWFYVAMSAWERWDVGLDYHRLLAPIIPLGIIMAAHAISVAADESKRGRWLGILAISCGLLVMLCCLKTLSAWMQRKWRTSETMKYVGAQLRNAEIYSPDPTAIFHYTRINARHLPYEFSTASGLTADAARLADYISTLRNVLLAGNGYIVYFKISEHNDQYLNMQDIKQDHYFQKIADFPDGEIWAAVR
jgi:4-amino-4-deoxy-L-arabinose transferase-like glycosyltransferase